MHHLPVSGPRESPVPRAVGDSHSGATRSCVAAATICLHPRQIDLRSIAQFAFDLGVTDGHIFH